MSQQLPIRDGKLQAADWAQLHVRLVWAYAGPPGISHVREVAPQVLIAWLLEAGEVRVTGEASGRAHATEGHWVFPAADMQEFEFSSNARILSLRCHAHWPNGDRLYESNQTLTVDASSLTEFNKAAYAILRAKPRALTGAEMPLELLKQEMTFAEHVRLERATLRWLAAYDRVMAAQGVSRTQTSESDSRVVQALVALNNYPVEQPLDEEQLSRSVGLSVSQLNRLFVPHVGITPRAYLQQRRLMMAKHCLLSRDLSIKQIAYSLGFREPSHFCHWFRKYASVPPTQFRKRRTPHISQLVE